MSLPRTLIDLASRIAPAHRRDWSEALRAELDHVPPGRATAFAAGALVAGLRLRLTHPPFVLAGARYGLAVAAVVWAALHLRFALPRLNGDPELPLLLELGTAAAFGLGGLFTAAAGLRATVWLGGPMLLAVGVYAAGAGALMPQSPNGAFYQALALEDLLALLIAVAVATAARGYARQRSPSAP